MFFDLAPTYHVIKFGEDVFSIVSQLRRYANVKQKKNVNKALAFCFSACFLRKGAHL